ncbi:MAG: hypothetical protein NTU80_01700 [Verrucomicrobia bacterium]|nr:hypothetical protein [Verrucomicrobiota bacterium]
MLRSCNASAVRGCALGLGLLIAGLLAACSSFESRAKEKAALFATLDPATQARLQATEIRLGDTPDLVYLALGRPSEKRERLTDAGRETVWVYTATWQEYQGTRLVGYRREVVRNKNTQVDQVIYTPDYQPIYAARAEDRMRVTFTNERVSALEQLQPGKGGAGSRPKQP